jgi:hypothetical protein
MGRSDYPGGGSPEHARAVIGTLLGELHIPARDLALGRLADGWCLELQCRVAGRWSPCLLELSPDAIRCGERAGPARDALAIELDEHQEEEARG